MAALYLLSVASKAAIFLASLYKINLQIQCMMMGRLCFLIALHTVLEFYKRVFQAFVGFFLMDYASNLKILFSEYNGFGCGFLIFGCFSKLCNVFVLFLMFLLGFKFFQFNGYFKFREQSSDDEFHGLNNSCIKSGTTIMSRMISSKGCGDQKLEEIDEIAISNCGFQFVEEEEKECCDEDQVFDVMSLRKMVKLQRLQINKAYIELEKERMAASSAANEALAMILRLQNEKSSLQIQVNQLQRWVEEKEKHDQDIIQSLQWIIMKHESERSLLEVQLKICKEKLRVFVKDEECDQFNSVCSTPNSSQSSFESRVYDFPIRSLDLDLSPM